MLDFLNDLWQFMRVRKKFWMAPILIIMLLLGALLLFAKGSALAPFIYTLFWKQVRRTLSAMSSWSACGLAHS